MTSIVLYNLKGTFELITPKVYDKTIRIRNKSNYGTKVPTLQTYQINHFIQFTFLSTYFEKSSWCVLKVKIDNFW